MNPPQIVGQGGPLLRPTDYRMAPPAIPNPGYTAASVSPQNNPPPRQIPAVPNFDPMYPPTPAPTFQQYMMRRMQNAPMYMPGENVGGSHLNIGEQIAPWPGAIGVRGSINEHGYLTQGNLVYPTIWGGKPR